MEILRRIGGRWKEGRRRPARGVTGATPGHVSRGYTSLERTATRDRPKARLSFLQKLRARGRENREVREAELHRQVDALLDKISREGMVSLTRKERKFLEWASKRLKRPA